MKKPVKFLGLRMSQSPRAINFWESILRKIDFKRIIEIGTEHGGLSTYFYLYCKVKGAEFITVDNVNHSKPAIIKESFYLVDAYSPEGISFISKAIQEPGITIVYCDGGDKARELKIYTPYLKIYDYIAVHDWGDAVWQADVPGGLDPNFISQSQEEGLTRIWRKLT